MFLIMFKEKLHVKQANSGKWASKLDADQRVAEVVMASLRVSTHPIMKQVRLLDCQFLYMLVSLQRVFFYLHSTINEEDV